MDERVSPAEGPAPTEAVADVVVASTLPNTDPAQAVKTVCPDCGCGAGVQPLCAVCGCNLAAVATLPTRSTWERSKLLALDVQARMIVERIAALVRFTPSLIAVPADERRLDSPVAVYAVQRAIRRAVQESIPRPQRPVDFAVHVRCADYRCHEESRMATASVAVGAGHAVQQDFRVALLTGWARAAVSRSGPPRLVAFPVAG